MAQENTKDGKVLMAVVERGDLECLIDVGQLGFTLDVLVDVFFVEEGICTIILSNRDTIRVKLMAGVSITLNMSIQIKAKFHFNVILLLFENVQRTGDMM